jgi:2'-deoxynucleoside 5'-phosphate N-hydrolase
MKIYFAGSIRGGRTDVEMYMQIIEYLKKFGEVLTEHIGDKNLKLLGEDNLTDNYIHNRDLDWVFQSDVLVVEVSTASLGVGYEIGRAIENKKRVLCLYRPQEGKRLSAMIAGCPGILIKNYNGLEDAKNILDEFFNKL